MTEDQLKGNPFYLSEDAVSWVTKTREALSLDAKVGQLFVVVQTPFMPEQEDLLSIEPGGVHLFAFSPEATKANQQAQIADMQRRSKLPLLVTGDLESGGFGGAIDGTNLAMNMQVAATGKPELARAFGEGIATEGAAMGFNWIFGPVLDINYNHQNPIVNTRAFGDTPEVVESYAIPALEGVQKSGRMAACVKHWPGDGMDDRDQHKVLTVNSMEMKHWRETYGRLYRSAFEAGAKSVMSAHIALPAYYKELGIDDVRRQHTPGSLSSELNVKLLREELGFNGLIISDATAMIGMTSWGPRHEIVPQCIAAGVDMFLFTTDLRFDYEAMLQGVRDGVITKQRLDEAVTRVLALKASLGLHLPQQAEQDLTQVGSPEQLALAEELARDSVTLVKDTQGLLPLSVEKHRRVLLISSGSEGSLFAENGSGGTLFAQMLAEEGFEVIRDYRLKPAGNDIDLVIFVAQKAPGFMQNSLRLSPEEAGGIFTWYPTTVPTVFISLGNPYTLYEMPTMPAMINGYNASAAVQRAILRCLLGKQPFRGVSPVDAFCGLALARL
ncbi:glycoside hydrolase family 3 protein [Paenibacillus sp. GCM10023248]|uniref:glycoside hydrolase family 3 protein n=1 Tax=unclassified Paenibacillus TaxID=185978 RepID=UPI002379F890|nr:glycoside hydrolase family 3 N-terminal domain-containing protein [Paenibacillus sp. MAHUQ-63]MDD9267291.1 glycoside hydrolase family 3 N-terminal domain-containing protein [Paenibacillus sp. MAHUQ-63]